MAKQNIVRRTISRAGDKMQEGWESAKDKFEGVEDSTEKYIKKNPLKSVLIALGIGSVIGAGITLGVESAVRARMRKQSFWHKYNPFD